MLTGSNDRRQNQVKARVPTRRSENGEGAHRASPTAVLSLGAVGCARASVRLSIPMAYVAGTSNAPLLILCPLIFLITLQCVLKSSRPRLFVVNNIIDALIPPPASSLVSFLGRDHP